MPELATSHVRKITREQVDQLRGMLEQRGWTFAPQPYAFWKASSGKTVVVAYESGKLSVQGKGTAEFVQFILEPEVLKEARFGYEAELKAVEQPQMFTPHAGVDESGKGDFFGPLVIAAVYIDGGDCAMALLKAGVADSKTISSDKRMLQLANLIRQRTDGRFSVVAIGPEAYNRLYENTRNVNKLLAWGHARAIENLLEKVPECQRAISDQFGHSKEVIRRALLAKGRSILLEQMHKAEADVAVAAASILARAEFITRLHKLGEINGIELPRGANAKVEDAAHRLVAAKGREALGSVAKLHFKTTDKILGGRAPDGA
jgi:ribonuclease HIII